MRPSSDVQSDERGVRGAAPAEEGAGGSLLDLPGVKEAIEDVCDELLRYGPRGEAPEGELTGAAQPSPRGAAKDIPDGW